ncbi:hypothetical protein ABEB36_013124 [Hypothenemus hampei]|uniref:Core Histone H2A/H2B/H3 domain-containing protein n=1 Tax=Hypothenemus hampei TaxID=57062 RepID=A0ABD1E762_HYPHA
MVRPKNPKPKKSSRKKTIEYITYRKKESCSRKVFREMVYFQRLTENLIPKLPFSRLVREIMQGIDGQHRAIQAKAMEALQISAEYYIVDLFCDAKKAAIHAHRQTVRPTDIKLALDLRGLSDVVTKSLN